MLMWCLTNRVAKCWLTNRYSHSALPFCGDTAGLGTCTWPEPRFPPQAAKFGLKRGTCLFLFLFHQQAPGGLSTSQHPVNVPGWLSRYRPVSHNLLFPPQLFLQYLLLDFHHESLELSKHTFPSVLGPHSYVPA